MAQDAHRRIVVEHGQEQVLQGQEFVSPGAYVVHGALQSGL
jgi:hypothetical protein